MDMIPRYFIKAVPELAEWIYAPLFRSCLQFCSEPFQWSGGLLHDFNKPGNVSPEVSHRRGVYLNDVVRKALHYFGRYQLAPHLCSYSLDSMYGGFKRRGVDFATLHLRVLSGFAKFEGWSFCAICVDLASALESVVRCLIFGPSPPSDEFIVHVILRLNCCEVRL